jgi:hypothetical protein
VFKYFACMFLCRPEDGLIHVAETCRLLVCFVNILMCCVRRLQPPEYCSSTAVWIIQILSYLANVFMKSRFFQKFHYLRFGQDILWRAGWRESDFTGRKIPRCCRSFVGCKTLGLLLRASSHIDPAGSRQLWLVAL